MYLGVNISHDASAALIDADGKVLYAIGEERLSRVKNYQGFPLRAIDEILSNHKADKIHKIIYGSYVQSSHLDRYIAQELGNPSNPRGKFNQTFPGFEFKTTRHGINPNIAAHNFMISQIPVLNGIDHNYVQHHDSHLGCALPLASDRNTLVVSLDGAGDGESGAISLMNANSSTLYPLARISDLDSLGLLYSAVTARYGFKPTHHEGKITGLAAYGKPSVLVESLSQYVKVKSGTVTLNYEKNRYSRNLIRTLHSFGIRVARPTSIEQIVDLVLTQNASFEYPDLAFAVQHVLEKAVCELISYWVDKTSVSQIALTGGVFANVRLNEKVTEIKGVTHVKVYPNMGDGGIAVGSVWSYLNKSGTKLYPELAESMLLGTEFSKRQGNLIPIGIKRTEYPLEVVPKLIAEKVAQRRVVAVLNGRMEFGPRALGSTSILLDPRDATLISEVNARLKRTEFMPFAPAVLENHFGQWFETLNQTLQPFKFMTMTCNVKLEKRHEIPAVTHVDGSARPQIVSSTAYLFFSKIIEEFYSITKIPLIVNTSFNLHEEPIIRETKSAFDALLRGAIDDLFTEDAHYEICKA